MAVASSDSDDLTEEEEIEEKLVFLDLVDNKQTFGVDTNIQLVGLDRDEPVANIDGIMYKGKWEDALGTVLIMDEGPVEESAKVDPLLQEPLETVYTIKHKIDKILKLTRCVVVHKADVETADLRKTVKLENADVNAENSESSEEENIEDVYVSTLGTTTPADAPGTSGNKQADADKYKHRFKPKARPDPCKQTDNLLETDTSQYETQDTSQGETQSSDVGVSEPQDYQLSQDQDTSAATSTLSQMSLQSLLEHSQATLSDITDLTLVDPTQSSQESQ